MVSLDDTWCTSSQQPTALHFQKYTAWRSHFEMIFYQPSKIIQVSQKISRTAKQPQGHMLFTDWLKDGLHYWRGMKWLLSPHLHGFFRCQLVSVTEDDTQSQHVPRGDKKVRDKSPQGNSDSPKRRALSWLICRGTERKHRGRAEKDNAVLSGGSCLWNCLSFFLFWCGFDLFDLCTGMVSIAGHMWVSVSGEIGQMEEELFWTKNLTTWHTHVEKWWVTNKLINISYTFNKYQQCTFNWQIH